MADARGMGPEEYGAGTGGVPTVMTASQRDVLLHTLGLNMTPKGLPHRNYFNATPGDSDHADCLSLAAAGLMRRGSTAEGGSVYFYATAEGVQAAVGLRMPRERIEAWLKTGKWTKGVRL
jgi:hypothetical protein